MSMPSFPVGAVVRIAGEHNDPRRFTVDHAWGPYGYDLTEIGMIDGSFRINLRAAHILLVDCPTESATDYSAYLDEVLHQPREVRG